MFKSYVAFLVFSGGIAASVVGCGRDTSTSTGFETEGVGVVKGKSVTKTENLAKSVVALVAQREDGQALCTGTILSEDTILTAAHCMDENPERMLVVFNRTIKKVPKDLIRNVTAFVQNPLWKKPSAKGRGDLALVHFDGGLPAGYKPVTIGDATLPLTPGTEVLMMGYGVNQAETHKGAGVLRETKSSIIEQESATELVTDGTKSSVCFGDSGGPAFAEDADGNEVQWGVTSSGKNEACNEASVHTNVIAYAKWIKSAAAKLSGGKSANGDSASAEKTSDGSSTGSSDDKPAAKKHRKSKK